LSYVRGANRERQVIRLLKRQGWHAVRTPASQGLEDIVAIKRGERARVIQVKATAKGPYERFGPRDREALRLHAEQYGAEALLCWWPPDRRGARWIHSSEWP
jgi:Holliday junction resolvase